MRSELKRWASFTWKARRRPLVQTPVKPAHQQTLPKERNESLYLQATFLLYPNFIYLHVRTAQEGLQLALSVNRWDRRVTSRARGMGGVYKVLRSRKTRNLQVPGATEDQTGPVGCSTASPASCIISFFTICLNSARFHAHAALIVRMKRRDVKSKKKLYNVQGCWLKKVKKVRTKLLC